MIKTKFRTITIAALTLVFAFVLSLAIGTLTVFKRAEAVDYRPATIFSAGTGGSVGVSGEEDGADKYVRFTLNREGKVHYRRDLALKWFEAAEAETDEELKNPAQCRYLSFEFSFTELAFTEFTVSFESAEENFSKNSKATNSIKFFRSGEETTVVVQNASEQDLEREEWESEAQTVDIQAGVSVRIDENECNIGEFSVYVNDAFVGKFTNVGGNYMEYLSSASTTPRIPITFTADKLAEGTDELKVLMKTLNGQSFRLNDAERIVDNAPAVLVINESIYNYNLGKRWSLTYEAIDVCDDTVTVTRRYAMAKKDADGLYLKPGKDDYQALTTSTYFMPTSDTGDVEEYVSIYFDLDDGSDLSGLTDAQKEARYIYLTWYAVRSAVATVGEGDQGFDYVKVNRDQDGPRYIGITADTAAKENKKETDEEGNVLADQRAAEYQSAVDEASKDLSAGDGAYFYLPSLRGLIESDYADYRNLRFSVYYRKQSHEVGSSANSATSLRYNALRFEIDEEGRYVFRVLASDASSNAMKLYYDGKLQDVTSSNIWDIDEIPEFSFEVGYKGAEIEEADSQPLGYSEQSYTFSSFKIIALEGYETEYSLYRLNRDEVPEGVSIPSYDTFVENTAVYFEELDPYMTEIGKYISDVTEEDEERWNNTFNAYHWNPDSSLSFTPQEPAFYVLKLVVKESRLPGKEAVGYQVIDVRNKIDPLPDPFNWLENNIASVVLFSIAAALAIVVVVLIVVKPSDKKIEEVDLESLKGKNKKDKKN